MWGKKAELAGNKLFGLHEDFPMDVAANRRKLYPIFFRAKQLNMKASLKGDNLFIAGTMYTVNSLGELEGELNPRKFCEKSNDNVIVFGGVLSEWHPFSNWSPCVIRYNGISFSTLEHAYLYTMAITFGDLDTAAAILAAQDAEAAKRLSHRIKRFEKSKWDQLREGVMEDLLRIKFAAHTDQGKELLSTENKQLAETGKGEFYPCGMSIIDRHVLDNTKWGRNALGDMLVKIRRELRE